MTRSELEHVIRAAGRIAADSQIIIIGSQSILGAHPTAPALLLASMEADVYPRNRPEAAAAIDGAIGEGSRFHQEFGYYAQGVGPETATLPRGWRSRLIGIKNANTGGVEGLCLEPHDLAISKYVAGREKDMSFTRLLARHGLTGRGTLRRRLAATKLTKAATQVVAARIERDFHPPGRPALR